MDWFRKKSPEKLVELAIEAFEVLNSDADDKAKEKV